MGSIRFSGMCRPDSRRLPRYLRGTDSTQTNRRSTVDKYDMFHVEDLDSCGAKYEIGHHA